jgi:hypothetical protein
MTVQFIRLASQGLPVGAIRILPPATEAALVADGEAIYTTVPNPAGDDLPVRFDPTTGMIVMSDGGPIAAQVALQGMVSSAGISARLRGGAAAVLAGDTSWIIPTHLPILNPERHAALATQALGNITMSYSATGGERTSSTIKFVASAAEATSRQWRIALPVSAEYGTTAKASGRLHIRAKCDDWSQVKRLYIGLTEQGGTTHYRYFKIIEVKSRYGMHNPASAARWNNQWRTLVECSDKQQVPVGTPAPWGADARYYNTDGVLFVMTTNGACTLEIDRIYSPDWPVGACVVIGDGCYKSFRDTVVPAWNARGWKLGVSGNKVDGSTFGVTTYPTLSDLAAMAAQGHDVFMHGHYLTGASPTSMTGSVTEAEVMEIMGAGRGAISAALGGIGARGMRWHQWLTNTGKYNGIAMDVLLKSLGVNAARGQCSDAEFGVDPYVSTYYTTSSADTRPSNYTGGNAAGWVSQQGRFNREYEEWWSDYNGTIEDHDTYAGGVLQKVVGYAATAGDVALTYTHNVLPRSLLGSPSYDAGTQLLADLLADLDAKQSAGQLIVLSPTQLEMLTYWREGDVYLRWDGEWVSRSTGAIAF